MAVSPDSDVRDTLNGVGGLVAGTNLFRGPVRPVNAYIPANACFVLATGGPPPEAFCGTATELHYSVVQVRVRSAPREYASGLTMSRAVRDALHHAPPVGYLEIEAQQSEPVYIGTDETGHHEWSINFELWHEQ